MRSCFKKIIAVLATFAIVASLSLSPVFATEYEARPTSWWDSTVMKAISTDIDIPLFDYLLVTAGDIASGSVCAGSSPDKLHHGSVTAEGERGGIDKAGQPYVWVKCKYCGDMFKGYASDLSAAYDDYVETLPATGYDSSGKLRYSPEPDYMYLYHWSEKHSIGCEHFPRESVASPLCSYSFDCATNSVRIMPLSGQTSITRYGAKFIYKGIAPIDGYYSRFSSPLSSGYWLNSNNIKFTYDSTYTSSNPVFYSAGASFIVEGSEIPFQIVALHLFLFRGFLPSMR